MGHIRTLRMVKSNTLLAGIKNSFSGKITLYPSEVVLELLYDLFVILKTLMLSLAFSGKLIIKKQLGAMKVFTKHKGEFLKTVKI